MVLKKRLSFFYFQWAKVDKVRNEYLRSYLNWRHNWQLKNRRRSHSLKGSHLMGDGRIFLKTRRNASYNKDLSNEPNFDRSISLDSTFNVGCLLISTVLWLLNNLLSIKTDVNIPTVVVSKKLRKVLFFSLLCLLTVLSRYLLYLPTYVQYNRYRIVHWIVNSPVFSSEAGYFGFLTHHEEGGGSREGHTEENSCKYKPQFGHHVTYNFPPTGSMGGGGGWVLKPYLAQSVL